MQIIPYTHSVFAVRHLVQHDICYVRNIIVIRRLVQHEVVATELILEQYSYYTCLKRVTVD